MRGFKVGGRGGEGVEVSHLLFVEDTLIICDLRTNYCIFIGS